MQVELHRLDALIGQILTLTRLQIQDDRQAETWVNLRSIVEGVVEDAQFEGKKEGKSVMIPRADACWLKGDPALLRSCIENVVRNAVRYTKPQTEVVVSLAIVGDPNWAQILVADRGNGVPDEALDRILKLSTALAKAGSIRLAEPAWGCRSRKE
jgi:two-component system sensor histidine kinase CpxA